MLKEYHDRAEATLSYADLSKTFDDVEIESKCSMAMSGDIKCKDNSELPQILIVIMKLMFHRK